MIDRRRTADALLGQGSYFVGLGAGPFGRRFGVDIFGQRLPRQRLQFERERREFTVPGKVLAIEVERTAKAAQKILHGHQMAHFLLGDAKNDLPPLTDFDPPIWRHFRPTERECRIEIFDHQGVLDLGGNMQKKNCVAMRCELHGDNRLFLPSCCGLRRCQQSRSRRRLHRSCLLEQQPQMSADF